MLRLNSLLAVNLCPSAFGPLSAPEGRSIVAGVMLGPSTSSGRRPVQADQTEEVPVEVRIATLVLDSTYGRAVVGLHARLDRADHNGWAAVADAETGSDGYVRSWDDRHLERGLYRIVFDSDSYFATLGISAAYPEVIVVFRIRNGSDRWEVQLTLSPYSYSTFFGSVEVEPADPA